MDMDGYYFKPHKMSGKWFIDRSPRYQLLFEGLSLTSQPLQSSPLPPFKGTPKKIGIIAHLIFENTRGFFCIFIILVDIQTLFLLFENMLWSKKGQARIVYN